MTSCPERACGRSRADRDNRMRADADAAGLRELHGRAHGIGIAGMKAAGDIDRGGGGRSWQRHCPFPMHQTLRRDRN